MISSELNTKGTDINNTIIIIIRSRKSIITRFAPVIVLMNSANPSKTPIKISTVLDMINISFLTHTVNMSSSSFKIRSVRWVDGSWPTSEENSTRPALLRVKSKGINEGSYFQKSLAIPITIAPITLLLLKIGIFLTQNSPVSVTVDVDIKFVWTGTHLYAK